MKKDVKKFMLTHRNESHGPEDEVSVPSSMLIGRRRRSDDQERQLAELGFAGQALKMKR